MTSFIRTWFRGMSLLLVVILLVGCQKETVKPMQSDNSSNSTSATTTASAVQSQNSPNANREAPQTKKVDSKKQSVASDVTTKPNRTSQPNFNKTKSSKTTMTNQTRSTKASGSGGTTSQSSSGTNSNSKTKATKNSTGSTSGSSASSSNKTNGTEGTSSSQQMESVTVTIKGYKNQTIVQGVKVPIQSDWTLMDATLSLLKEKGIQYDVSGSGASAYVKGIDNVYEFDHGAKSGWMATKNGQSLTQSAGIIPIKPGDLVEWQYTTGD